jgi:hypothetical protein
MAAPSVRDDSSNITLSSKTASANKFAKPYVVSYVEWDGTLFFNNTLQFTEKNSKTQTVY